MIVVALLGGFFGWLMHSAGGFFGFVVGAMLSALVYGVLRQRDALLRLETELVGLRALERVRIREPDASVPLLQPPSLQDVWTVPVAVAAAPIESATPIQIATAGVVQAPPEPAAAALGRAVFQVDEAQALPEPMIPADVPAFKRAPQAASNSTPRAAANARLKPSAPSEPGLERHIVEFFTGGNWPVKAGVLLLFAGVAALLKYAIENELLRLPIEFRLLGIATLGLLAVGFGYRQVGARRVFGLSIQGLGLGVFALTTYAAYARFGFISVELCLALVMVTTGIAVALALLQDALALAWLAAFGAYLAPWIAQVADAPGSLFGYYLVVNVGVLLIAFKKDWRSLNLLAFFATFFVGSIWGAQFYRPEFLAVTEPYLLLHGLLFGFIGWLFAARGPESGLKRIETALVFGAPLAVLLLQGLLLVDDPEALGRRAFLLGALHAVAAYALHYFGRLRTLKRCYIAIAAALITLAVPLCFSAPTTAMVFALQSLALMWLAVYEGQSRLLRYLSTVLYLLALPAYVLGFAWQDNATPIFNGPGLGALALVIAGLGNAWLLSRAIARLESVPSTARIARLAFFTMGALILQFGAIAQIEHFSVMPQRMAWIVLLAAFASALGIGLSSALKWPIARRFSELNVPLMLVALVVMSDSSLPLFGEWRGIAWLAYLGSTLLAIRLRCSEEGFWISVLRMGWPLLTVALLTLELLRKIWLWELGSGLALSLFAAPALVFLATLVIWPDWLERLFGREGRGTQISASLAAGLSVLAFVWVLVACSNSGDVSPMRFFPLFNVLEGATILAIALIWFALRERVDQASLRFCLVGIAFIALSAAALRWTHQLFGDPWGPGLLDSMRAQSALSMLWTLAGMVGMLLGARRGWRRPWQFGAAVIVLVLVKLAFIDRHFLSDLSGISAFLVVGSLLVVVGYFAPQPPPPQVSAEPR